MPLSGKVLEDSIRLSKIRRIKLTLYIVQTGALLGIALFAVFVFGHARITPTLYLPLPSFISVLILLLLITCVESFFFRMLEIRFARSASARHLMAKNSMRRSLLIAIGAGIAAIILAMPSVLGAFERASDEEVVTNSVAAPSSFYSTDALGIMSVKSVRVEAPVTIEVFLVKQESYLANKGNLDELFALRINKAPSQFTVVGELTIRVPTGLHELFYLIIDDNNSDTYATYTFVKSASGTFTGLILILLIGFVVVNVAWFAYLTPVERKYSAGSIYR